MKKEDAATPVYKEKCQTCEFYNKNKKRCFLKVCKFQLSLFDIVGGRF